MEAAIRSVLDLPAFDAEVEREKREQGELERKRPQLRRILVEDGIE